MPGGGDPLLAFDVGEDHEQWFEIRATLDGWGVSEGHVTTKFSREEVAQARWLDLVPDWHHGYPQPDEHESRYLSVTYDLSGWCSMCGTGLRQKAPLQMKAEPKWGRRGILQLNWVFDEYFVTPEEYFGSGAAADRCVLVSQELAGALIAAKVRGASLWPTMSRSLPGQESREATAP